MTLKTLKDFIETIGEIDERTPPNFVLFKKDKLKDSAIEWIKELERKDNCGICTSCTEGFFNCEKKDFQIEWITHFFGVTEADLK